MKLLIFFRVFFNSFFPFFHEMGEINYLCNVIYERGRITDWNTPHILYNMSNNLFNKLANALAADQNPIIMVTAQDLKEFARTVAEEVQRQMPALAHAGAGRIRDDDGNEKGISSNRLLSARETIELLKISLPTLWRWGKKGYLVPIQVGNGLVCQRRYSYDDVMRIIKKGKNNF